ncbi:MAG: radical SAM protein [Planctomycetes bacterium]|nr:radical SAM protein [Planctomycetota bacterium]
MRRPTRNAGQLKKLYATEDGRLQGQAGWEKLPLFWFHLFLSYQCTRRCSYCYALNQAEGGGTMDERTFSRLLEWIPEVWRANRVKVNAIGFLGGEPLLRTDRIRRVMDSIFRNTDGMQGFVYTAGDTVDSVNWDDLEDIQWISTNVTDLSLEELSRRMRVVEERSNAIGQTIVATLDDGNLERVLEITRFGVEKGYRLRLYRNLYRGLDDEYKRRLLRKYHEVCDLLENYASRGFAIHTTFLLDTLIPTWSQETSPYPCGERAAVVFPDGSIGPCIRNHTSKVGTVFDPDPVARLQSPEFRYDLKRPELPEDCRTCESRTACQGGCPNDRVILTGTATGRSPMCEIHREIIPRLRRLEALKRA